MGGLVVGLAGCSNAAEPEPTRSPTPTPSTPAATPSPTPTPAPPIQPLSGRPLTDPSILTRPAVAVKVPNLKAEQPQVGINDADLVICQPNGEGSTRICPVFHSTYPEAVGPVRSMRPADVPLLSPIFPLLANTGAADWVTSYIDDNSQRLEKMTYLDFRKTPAFSVNKERLYKVGGKTQYDRAIQAHPAGMAGLAKRAGAPGPYLTFAADGATASSAGGSAAKEIAIPYGEAHKYDMSYVFDEATGTYLRSQPWGEHVLADGSRVAADSVLVVKTKWEYGKIGKGRDNPDPIMDLIDAKGDFLYLHGGLLVKGGWTKGAAAAPFVFTCADGSPLLVAPGRTWLEFPRPTADVVVR